MTNTKLIASLLAAAALTMGATAYAEPQQDAAMAGAAAASGDTALTSKVKAVLADQKQIGVSANQGVVTLTGTVASTDEGTKAIQAASAVEGVKEVKSELTVASK
ncbi:hyperosmotically inducible protein [Pseudoduganella flava]|uniref:BON domain-containing protein n=1 Tax=Pseudoduganella flava TaxID=871742 RepID=A0A562PTA1_9BURK|nr:BON domain-containing protein [Pseudoduganella flava]QGZ39050.1 BON domain-containing protein [Pseudoduganella flava]TWI47677.1 hyperosmotically inducible protein [Pseudoduganella flava]